MPVTPTNIVLRGEDQERFVVSLQVVEHQPRIVGFQTFAAAAQEQQPANGMGKGLAGAAKLAAGALGLRRGARPETIQQRKAMCLACPSAAYDFGLCSKLAGGCGCVLAAKVMIAAEACPAGHWTKEDADADAPAVN